MVAQEGPNLRAPRMRRESGRLGARPWTDRDSERLQKTRILGADAQLRFALPRGRSKRRSGFSPIEADRGLDDDENVIAIGLDARNHFRYLLGAGNGIVNGLTELLHKPFEFLVHGGSPFGAMILDAGARLGVFGGEPNGKIGGKDKMGGIGNGRINIL